MNTTLSSLLHLRIPSILAGLACLTFGMRSNVAFSNPQQPVVADAANAPSNSQTGPLISQGSAMAVDKLGIQITPPVGWEVTSREGVLSLVMQEVLPPQAKPDYSKPIFRRNITVAAMHRASPIDETRANELRDELTRTFSADPSVQNFQVLEHKFFNYKGQNDGLLVYSSLTLREFPMMQMHILVSGAEKQFLLTYTDLAESFAAGGPRFEQVWNSMVSINVTGVAPDRWSDLIRYGGISGALLLMFALIVVFGRRAARRRREEAFREIEESDYSGDPVTDMGEWNLTRRGNQDDESFDHAVSQAKQAFVSQPARTTSWASQFN